MIWVWRLISSREISGMFFSHSKLRDLLIMKSFLFFSFLKFNERQYIYRYMLSTDLCTMIHTYVHTEYIGT